MNNKEHWQHIYSTKLPKEVSWTEEKPVTSLELIAKFDLPKFAKIIDIGGGDSLLVDFLLHEGYTNITVLDISAAAIDRAKMRLGKNAHRVKWIVSDIKDFTPTESYDLWHDRAAFHFLTEQADMDTYSTLVRTHTKNIVLGTFSINGPLKCSGLEITQYNEAKFQSIFGEHFKIIECFTLDHTTPFYTTQNFIFVRMSKNKIT